jgi:hypothetical protein
MRKLNGKRVAADIPAFSGEMIRVFAEHAPHEGAPSAPANG